MYYTQQRRQGLLIKTVQEVVPESVALRATGPSLRGPRKFKVLGVNFTIRGRSRPSAAARAARTAAFGPEAVIPAAEVSTPWLPMRADRDHEKHPWDLAHAAAEELASSGEADASFIEPDLEQSGSCGGSDGQSPDPYWPDAGFFGWHLDASTLREARTSVSNWSDSRVRIVHLDTGYDPRHSAMPRGLNNAFQRSFVEGERDRPSERDDARDRGVGGILNNPGHGTGTIALLAGGRVVRNSPPRADGYRDVFDGDFGGCPEAEVIPVRIANSVIHLKTDEMALGIEYAASLAADRPLVVSLSMGGLPSRRWSDAVDVAYLAGVAIFAAAGNRIGKSPPSSVVWPARFPRVTCVCGVNADGQPYYRFWNFAGHMQGCFGPESVMSKAISAHTPNVPWAKMGTASGFDLDGAGTSSATPQVAATAALWYQQNGHLLGDYEPWQRVEAVREAIFQAAQSVGERERFGNGILRSAMAVRTSPRVKQALTQAPSAPPSWQLLQLLFGFSTGSSVASVASARGSAPARDEMFGLEAAQLTFSLGEVDDLVYGTGAAAGIPIDKRAAILRSELACAPDVSDALRDRLNREFRPSHALGWGGARELVPRSDLDKAAYVESLSMMRSTAPRQRGVKVKQKSTVKKTVGKAPTSVAKSAAKKPASKKPPGR